MEALIIPLNRLCRRLRSGWRLFLVACLLTSLASAVGAQSSGNVELQIKAAYLLKFGNLSVPAGSRVVSASLTISLDTYTSNPGNISGLYSTLPMLIRGQRVVLLERFSIPAWRDYVVRYRPVHSGLPPSCVKSPINGLPRRGSSIGRNSRP